MKKTRKFYLLGIALLLGIAASLISGNLVSAAGPAAVPAISGTTQIALTASESSQTDNPGIIVSAKLTDNGKPIGNQTLEFDVAANFFGEQQVNIGTLQTNAVGSASVVYEPSQDGTYEITAHFMGDKNYPHVQMSKTITYSGPVQPVNPEDPGLSQVRHWITPVVYTGVGFFWLFLIFIAFRTLKGISRART